VRRGLHCLALAHLKKERRRKVNIKTKVCPKCGKEMVIMISPGFQPQLIWFWRCDCGYEAVGGIEWDAMADDRPEDDMRGRAA